MVNQKEIEAQLKKINFNPKGWNRSEVAELPNILLADEHIYECANGFYEGGFALLVATDVRVVLVDKKPMGFLSVEDLRFDMINEIDYSHRLMGANITIATGNKTLIFRSYDKERLRKLIGHVQHCMAEGKKKQSSNAEGQHQHLEQINQQLQAYLVSQYNQQQKMQEHLASLQAGQDAAEPPKLEAAEMSPQLKDYLYAHGLMEKYRQETGQELQVAPSSPSPAAPPVDAAVPTRTHAGSTDNQLAEIYAEGMQEIFGKDQPLPQQSAAQPASNTGHGVLSVFEVNPLKIAYMWLPQALRSRKFGLSMPTLASPFVMPASNQTTLRR